MANQKYDEWSIKKIEDEILKARLFNIALERDLCFTLAEKAKLENDRHALAFSYTYLSDYFLTTRENSTCLLYLDRALSLSKAMSYEDLLVRIYNFYGMFYNSICDEVNALDNFLKSLELAKKRHDVILLAGAYNNIATCFHVKHDYKEAMLYYRRCKDILCDSDDSMKYSVAVSLTNLCSCAFQLEQIEEIDEIIKHFEILIQEESEQRSALDLLALYCQMMKEYVLKEYTAIYQSVERILKQQEQVENRLLVHQVFTCICDMLLNMKDQQYSKKVLDLLVDINQDNDQKTQKELQKLVVRYCDAFESEAEQLIAYKEFYKIIVSIEDRSDENSSAGLSAKLELYDAKVRQLNLKKENEHLEKIMNIDDLCGTRNRRCFNHDICDSNLLQYDTLAVAMLDLDYFKQYNDIYGHLKGDMALIEVGKTLNMIASDTTFVYRYGGDEFSIIFKNQSEEEVQRTLEWIRKDIEHKAIEHQGSTISDVLSITCDYAFTNEKISDVSILLEQADLKLYKEKKKRKQEV